MAARPTAGASGKKEPGPPPVHAIELNAAVSEIRQACEESDPDAGSSPFFLIVGAGISFPPVPLSASIIEHCKQVATRYKRTGKPISSSTLDTYSHWFSRAYPQPRLRQRYLRSLIEDQPLSVASLRLAHLLSARTLTNLVVTTNFDDFVERALRLFGEEPAVCDHPRTIARIDADSQDLQIAHVHGSYLFYDCANLTGEVAGRAQADEETSLTIVGLLDSVLWNRSPLVIGYSGWEGDVVMSALRRRLRGGGLPQSIYWFVYKASEVERLPDWLRLSPDVRFVVPVEQETGADSVRKAKERSPVEESEADEGRHEPTLPAREVFDKLNQGFDIGEPSLFLDPIEYFAKHLERSLPGGDSASPGSDPYAFRALIQRIRSAAGTAPALPDTQGPKAELERLREAMRASEYKVAVEELAKIIPARLGDLSEAERQEVLDAADLAGSTLLKTSPDEAPDLLAQILSIDDRRAERVAPQAPPGLVVVFPSRAGLFNYEIHAQGKLHGAFTFALANALDDPQADRDGDGNISLYDAVVTAGIDLIGRGIGQTPVLVGDGQSLSLFKAKKVKAADRSPGRVIALLVCVADYAQKGLSLGGPANDRTLMSNLLTRNRARSLYRGATVEDLADAEATVDGVREGLKRLGDKAEPDDLVVFYFSGRSSYVGDQQGDWALFLHETDGRESGQLPLEELIDTLGRLKARRTLILLD